MTRASSGQGRLTPPPFSPPGIPWETNRIEPGVNPPVERKIPAGDKRGSVDEPILDARRRHGGSHGASQENGRASDRPAEAYKAGEAHVDHRLGRRRGRERIGEAGNASARLASLVGRIRETSPRLWYRRQKHERRWNGSVCGRWNR